MTTPRNTVYIIKTNEKKLEAVYSQYRTRGRPKRNIKCAGVLALGINSQIRCVHARKASDTLLKIRVE